MYNDKTTEDAVEKIAAEARALVEAMFANPKPNVKASVEVEPEKEETPKADIFDLNKDGKENYDFLTSKRVSKETEENYNAMVDEILSECEGLSREHAELCVNMTANYMDLMNRMYSEHYNPAIATYMLSLFNGAIHEHIMLTAKVCHSKEILREALLEVDDYINRMIEVGTPEQRLNAIGLRLLEGEYKIFGFLYSRLANAQYDHVTGRFGEVNPHNHIKTLFHLNRVARVTCEASCAMYQKITT